MINDKTNSWEETLPHLEVRPVVRRETINNQCWKIQIFFPESSQLPIPLSFDSRLNNKNLIKIKGFLTRVGTPSMKIGPKQMVHVNIGRNFFFTTVQVAFSYIQSRHVSLSRGRATTKAVGLRSNLTIPPNHPSLIRPHPCRKQPRSPATPDLVVRSCSCLRETQQARVQTLDTLKGLFIYLF